MRFALPNSLRSIHKLGHTPGHTPWHVAGGIALILLLLYGLFQARDLIRGPVLTVEQPLNGAAVHDSLVTVSGAASHITNIALNDRQIFINEEGDFEEEVLLSEGYNILTVRVEDRFGRSEEEQLELMYIPE